MKPAHIVILVVGCVVFLIIMMFKSAGPVVRDVKDLPKSEFPHGAPPYGTKMNLISDKNCCFVADSKDDLYDLTRMAQSEDELSIRQMVAGGKVWSQPPNSRVVVIGAGTYGSGIKVRFMDGKTGWVGPKMLVW